MTVTWLLIAAAAISLIAYTAGLLVAIQKPNRRWVAIPAVLLAAGLAWLPYGWARYTDHQDRAELRASQTATLTAFNERYKDRAPTVQRVLRFDEAWIINFTNAGEPYAVVKVGDAWLEVPLQKAP